MDFMKVFDQAIRDITREVNLKVLKIPEIEQKVLDATSDEPWGPHGSDMAEIARATKKSELIMNVIRSRLRETGRNWRHVYKALTVLEYLIAHGSERIVDDIIEITHRITSVAEFEYVEPNGKDVGINVRKKAQTVLDLLHNKDKIREVREKASANKEKYIGLSSTGITYKSSSSTYGGSGVNWSERDETFADSYKGKDYNGFGTDSKASFKDDFYKETGEKPGRGDGSETEYSSSRKRTGKYGSASKETVKQYSLNKGHGSVSASQNSKTSQDCVEDDFDDFDPRGSSSVGGQNDFDPRASSSAGTATAKSGHDDLFNKSLIDDLIDIHTDVTAENICTGSSAVPEVDLFAGANFVSASSHAEAGSDSHSQVECDLFAHQSAATASFSPTVDLFASPEPVLPSAAKLSSESDKMPMDDPFASVPLNTFQDSDLFGAFTSSMDAQSSNPPKVETLPTESKGNSTDGLQTQTKNSFSESKAPPKKDTFQVKSSIWADSLSRGLIDLNISSPNKTSLVDIGIVGGLNDVSDQKDEKDWTLPASFQMGKAMGTGSGLGRAGFTSTSSSDGSFPDLSQQFGSFK
ncbi:clathrin interactor EPSIN 1 isoform X2 [Nymphaea colorata]|uniref:clathrin interactor EPSIN 1 isoform X2 n=1 Tax=Nymphaea colorata TaxID=210225 RepID=UPI00129EEAE6|nr:clathrin interactor EPSIN 1 isoform X2 [Nymphaea colorata]